MSTELVPFAQPGALVNFDTYQGPTGLETVTQADLGTPRFTIVQDSSAFFKKTHAAYEEKKIEGCNPGDIVLPSTKQVVYTHGIDKGVYVVPTGYRTLFQEWKSRAAGGGFVTTHASPNILSKCKEVDIEGRRKVVVIESGNEIVETKTFAVIAFVNGIWSPAIISMAGGNMSAAREWLNRATSIRLSNGKQSPLFSHAYSIGTTLKRKNANAWYAYSIQLAGPVNKQEVIDAAQAQAGVFEEAVATAGASEDDSF